MTDLKHVTEWCEAYSEKTKLKIFPQSAPVLAMIEDILCHVKMQSSVIEKLCGEFHLLDYKFKELQEKLTMPAKKVDKKEVKK